VKSLRIAITILSFVCISQISIADNAQLQARKDIAALNVEYNIDQLMQAIAANDSLLIDLFLKSGLDINQKVAFFPYIRGNIPDAAFRFFTRYMGSGMQTPPEFQQYDLEYTRKFDAYGIEGTPLMLAVYLENEPIVDMMLKHGVSPNTFGKDDRKRIVTALTLGISKKNPKIVSKLISSGADVIVNQDDEYKTNVIKNTFVVTTERSSIESKDSLIEIANLLDEKLSKEYYTSYLKRIKLIQ